LRNLNETQVFYRGGVAAAMTRKWSLSTAPSVCYGAEFTAFARVHHSHQGMQAEPRTEAEHTEANTLHTQVRTLTQIAMW